MDLSHCGTCEGTHSPPLDAGSHPKDLSKFPLGESPGKPGSSLSPHLSLRGVEVVVEAGEGAGK